MAVDHKSSLLQPFRAFLSTLTYPVQVVADAPELVGDWLEETTSSQESLTDQNRDLKQLNLQLQAQLQKMQSLEAENLRLRNLLDSSFKVGERVLIAELSAMELDPYSQKVVINKGSRSGVFNGQPVLDAHAVMGQVVSVSPVNATVLLITDASHALPVQVMRNGLRTIAVGTGEINRLSLPFLPRNADIREGDMLVTSGLGGKFPPGYPVAEVSEVILEEGQHFASVNATPLDLLDRSREVLLVWKIPRPLTNAVATENTQPAAEEKKTSAEQPPETPVSEAAAMPSANGTSQ
jgi:rod shape-determining protein MreC